MDNPEDAIVEDAVRCDLCGESFLVGDNGPVILQTDPSGAYAFGRIGGQLKLCAGCAMLVHDAYRKHLRDAGVCEHGTDDGEYCEDCSREYKRARRENA